MGQSPAHADADAVADGAARGKGMRMADVAYVALTIAVFGLLALMVRGLEKLR